MSKKILLVDDDANVLKVYQYALGKKFTIDTALGGELGLIAMVERGPFGVVVTDMSMPGMNGVEFLAKAQEIAPDTVRVMLTGNMDQKTAADAVNLGHVFRFLDKPCPLDILGPTMTAALRQYDLVTAERELLERTLNGSVKLLTDILSMIDPPSFGQAKLLRDNMKTYIEATKVSSAWEFEIAAMLSSIGLVTVPPTVLNNARSGLMLSGAEKDILARVPETGSDLLANIPRLENVARIIRFQNKHYDGSGFPAENLAGEEIPLGSRIIKLLSDMLQLEAKGLSRVQAFKKMQAKSGRYDPKVMEAAVACFEIYLPSSKHASLARRAITVDDLRVKQVLASDLLTRNGALISCEGTEISQMILAKIHNFEDLVGVMEPIHVYE